MRLTLLVTLSIAAAALPPAAARPDSARIHVRERPAPVSYSASSSGEAVACGFGLASGAGELVFAQGELAFGFEEKRMAATPLLEFTGAKSGSANGIATPSADGDPVATLAACGGDGLEVFLADLRLRTSSPLAA